jgi:hypothetical protein
MLAHLACLCPHTRADKPRGLPNASPGRERGAYGRVAFRREFQAFLLQVPFSRALGMPAATRSLMIERSNSTKTPSIWRGTLPAGVLVSIPCLSRYTMLVRATRHDPGQLGARDLGTRRKPNANGQPALSLLGVLPHQGPHQRKRRS